MSSPFIPCPFQYNDIPSGAGQALMQIASIAPPINQNQYAIGTFWLNTANGSLYCLANFVAGVPTWELILSDQVSGTTAAMSGTPGAVTVSNSAVTSTSQIIFSRKTTNGTPGQVSITAQSSGSFTLTSTGNETSTFNYLIIN